MLGSGQVTRPADKEVAAREDRHPASPLTRAGSRPARPNISGLLLDARGPVAGGSAMALSG